MPLEAVERIRAALAKHAPATLSPRTDSHNPAGHPSSEPPASPEQVYSELENTLAGVRNTLLRFNGNPVVKGDEVWNAIFDAVNVGLERIRRTRYGR
jgi:hypothetical protein